MNESSFMIILLLLFIFSYNITHQIHEPCCYPSSNLTCRYFFQSTDICNISSLRKCCYNDLNEWYNYCVEYVREKYDICESICGNGICEKDENDTLCHEDCGKGDDGICQNETRMVERKNMTYWKKQWYMEKIGMEKSNGLEFEFGKEKRRKIGIIDDGIQRNHVSLKCSVVNDEYYEEPGMFEDHGTAVVGLISSNKYIYGIAPMCRIVNLKIKRNINDQELANVFSNKNVDVFCNSWMDNERLFMESGKEIKKWFVSRSVIKDQSLKGKIFVFPSGNKKEMFDHSNYHQLVNTIYGITVSSSDIDDKSTVYSESGTNVFVNAPSHNYKYVDDDRVLNDKSNVFTIDKMGIPGYTDKNYIDNFEGGSSLAIVTGVISLILEYKPELTLRDIQWLLSNNSDKIDPQNENWVMNSAKISHNILYGFGRINVTKCLLKLEKWKGVCQNHVSMSIRKENMFLKIVKYPIVFELDVNNTIIIEHVEVVLNMEHHYRGLIKITIISPSKTTSIVVPGRKEDDNSDLHNISFLTLQFWGESSNLEENNVWKVIIEEEIDVKQQQNVDNHGLLNYLELKLHGYYPKCDYPVKKKDKVKNEVILSIPKLIVLCVFALIIVILSLLFVGFILKLTFFAKGKYEEDTEISFSVFGDLLKRNDENKKNKEKKYGSDYSSDSLDSSDVSDIDLYNS